MRNPPRKNWGEMLLPPGTVLYHGSPEPYATEIRRKGSLTWGHRHKMSAGSLTEGGMIWFFTGKEKARLYSTRSEAGRKTSGTGGVFAYELADPLRVAGYYMELTRKQADILNDAIPLPGYKSLDAGSSLSSAAYRAHELSALREKYPSYQTDGGQMMVIWPTILKAIGYDAYYYGSEHDQIAIPAEEIKVIAGNPRRLR